VPASTRREGRDFFNKECSPLRDTLLHWRTRPQLQRVRGASTSLLKKSRPSRRVDAGTCQSRPQRSLLTSVPQMPESSVSGPLHSV